MEEKKDQRRSRLEAVILVSVLATAVVGLWFLAEYVKEGMEVEEIEEPITVTLRIEGDTWSKKYIDVSTINNTVFKLLMECAEKNNFEVAYTNWNIYDAVFVNAINGSRNGENGLWWQYYVNDDYGDVGCDRKEIFHGDLVEWRFQEPGQ